MPDSTLSLDAITLVARERSLHNPGIVATALASCGFGGVFFAAALFSMFVGTQWQADPATRLAELEVSLQELEVQLAQAEGTRRQLSAATLVQGDAATPVPLAAVAVAVPVSLGALTLTGLGLTLGFVGIRRRLRFREDGVFLDGRRIPPEQIVQLEPTDGGLQLTLSDGRRFDVPKVDPTLVSPLISAAKQPVERVASTEPEALSALRRRVRQAQVGG